MKTFFRHLPIAIIFLSMLSGCESGSNEQKIHDSVPISEAMPPSPLPEELIQYYWDGDQISEKSIDPSVSKLFPFLATPVTFEALKENLLVEVEGSKVHLLDSETGQEASINLDEFRQYFRASTGSKFMYFSACKNGQSLTPNFGSGKRLVITDGITPDSGRSRIGVNESGGTTILVVDNILEENWQNREAGPSPIVPPLGDFFSIRQSVGLKDSGHVHIAEEGAVDLNNPTATLPGSDPVIIKQRFASNCETGKSLLFTVTMPKILLKQCGNLLFFTSPLNSCLEVIDIGISGCDICIVYSSVSKPGIASPWDSYSVYVDNKCLNRFKDECFHIPI